jgi:hypothetical protein
MRRSSSTILFDEFTGCSIVKIASALRLVTFGSPSIPIGAPGNFHRTLDWHPERPDVHRLLATDGSFGTSVS